MQDLGGFKDRNTADGIGRDGLAGEVALRVQMAGVNISKVKVRHVLDELFAVVGEALLAGKRVEIRGFGSFKAIRKNSRRSFVPSKGKIVKVDARWTVRFETSDSVKRDLMKSLEV